MPKTIFKIALNISLLIGGLIIVLYPAVEDYLSSLYHRYEINDYQQQVNKIEDVEYQNIISQVKEYNHSLIEKSSSIIEVFPEEHEEYENLLNIYDGILGSINIPKIDVSLPILHGTTAQSLEHGAAHMEGTTLPAPDEETSHIAICAHTGLPSSKMFDDIQYLVEGDIFYIGFLNEKIFYEVDNIIIADPDDASMITFEEGKNYCSLVTCTPFGVNSHRLVVRGHQIDAPDGNLSNNISPTQLLVNTHNEIYYVLGVVLSGACIAYILVKRKSLLKKISY